MIRGCVSETMSNTQKDCNVDNHVTCRPSIASDDHDPFDFHSLIHAAYLCRKNVSWKENVTLWMDNVVKNCMELEYELKSGTYRMGEPRMFHIVDPKPRTISAMRYRDRVVHRSLCECGLYDDLTRDLIYDNCACQKGKGTSFAIKRIKHHLRRYFRMNGSNIGYVIRLDIRKYFPSIPHDLLKTELRKRVHDKRVIDIVEYVIDEFVKVKFDEDLSFNDNWFGIRGLGLGSQISQLLALMYLSDLDHHITEKMPYVTGYIRYMDDMVMFVKTKDLAYHAYNEIEEFVNSKGLKLNPKSRIFPMNQPIEFLKIFFTLTNTGKVKYRIVRKCLNREIKRINKLIKRFKENHISYERLLQHTNTWYGFAKERCSDNQLRYIRKLIKDNFKDFNKITPILID